MFTRFNGNVEPFAKDATGTERTVFGDTAQSDDINDNLNTDFLRGWGIVGVNDNPTKQDFNALAYTISNLVAYLYQQGVSEWNTDQEYLTNSYCVGSDGKLYRAKTGTSVSPNQGNDPTTDSTNWENLDSKFVDLLNAQTIAGIKTFSSFPVTPSTAPSSNYQVANKKYVDDEIGGIDLSAKADKTEVIGINQTWQNVTGSRSTGVTYTNTTGKPLFLYVCDSGDDASYKYASGWIDGIRVYLYRDGSSGGSGYSGAVLNLFVPAGSTYKVQNDGNFTMKTWFEFR